MNFSYDNMLMRMMSCLLAMAFGICFDAPKGNAKGASLTGEGSVEFGIQGLVNLSNKDTSTAYLDWTLGYFFAQNIEIGLSSLNGTTATGQRDTFGIFGEYDYENGSAFIPFAGIFAKHAAAPTASNGKDARIFGFTAGSKFRVADNVALAATLVWQTANERVFGLPETRTKSGSEITFGLKFFF